MKAQRPAAELCENGVAKRHLPCPFSAHPPGGFTGTPFIYGGALSGAWGVTVKVLPPIRRPKFRDSNYARHTFLCGGASAGADALRCESPASRTLCSLQYLGDDWKLFLAVWWYSLYWKGKGQMEIVVIWKERKNLKKYTFWDFFVCFNFYNLTIKFFKSQ